MIELRGLRLMGRHGVGELERQSAQPFELDLDVFVDTSRSAISDDVSDTIDYQALVDAASRVVTGQSFRLLEALAGKVAEEVLADERVERVDVSVRKLRPPVPFDIRSAGVRITRSRNRAPDRDRTRAFVGIGSNMGDRLAFIRRAVAGLPDVAAVSPVYETEPVGGPAGQDPYLNVVVELRTVLSPRELLEIGAWLEADADRRRDVKDGPRTLDVDILLVGDDVVHESDLEVPHPRMWERRFVLAPLADLAPELVSPDRLRAAGGNVHRLIDSLWIGC
jgi:dihydroneopterin aldolase/2-amino-4-hydroxy-6-hydroxymethyldihydropteridine diphosphokinase